MKKILMLTNEYPPIRGGTGTYVHQLALAASNIGHDVTVVTIGLADDISREKEKTYPFRVVRYSPTVGSYQKWPNAVKLAWHWTVASESTYDIVHALDLDYIIALGFINKFKSIPFVATVYGTEILRVFDSKPMKYLFVKHFFDTPQHIFAISEFTKSLLLKRRRIPPENVTVTMLGVNPSMFEVPQADLNIREIYSVPKNHKIILTVSRLDERKGHRVVLNAIEKLPVEFKREITYLIVGSGIDKSYAEELRQLAARSEANVLLAGQVPDDHLKPLYAASTIFCMPGEPHPEKVEGFGLVYFEAAAQGVPSIASRLGGVPEVVLHEKTGLLIEPMNESQLVQALTKFLSDEPYRLALGREACDYARSITWARCAEQTYGL